MLAGDQNHVAAVASVTAAGTATGDELLASERKTAVTAVAGFNRDDYFVYKHIARAQRSAPRLKELAKVRVTRCALAPE